MMRPRFTTPLMIVSLLVPVAARAQGVFSQVDLLSDVSGEALNSTAAIVNPWGLVRTSDGGFWMAINGTANALAVGADGTVQRMVAVPTAAGLGPTGIVMNSDVNAFRIEKDGVSGAARVIVSGLDGTLSGWNPDVDPDNFIQASHDEGEVYTGMAIAKVGRKPYLYLANFAGGEVEVYDTDFEDAELAGDFEDPDLPENYSPFNVQEIDGHLYVAYALPGPGGEEQAGAGLGIVSEFDAEGRFVRRVVSNGVLNAPWAVVQAPGGFGRFGGAILIGNFGDGTINAFDRRTGEFLGTLTDARANPIVIEGLWGLEFSSHGKGSGGRPSDDGVTGNVGQRLYFAAGIDDEEHGLFGYLAAEHGSPQKAFQRAVLGPPGNKIAAPTRTPMRLSEGAMSFRIEAPASEAIVLRIYDSSGRLVATPASGVSGVSEIRWDGKTADGTRAQSGVYFYSVQSGGRTSGGRLVVLP